MQDEVTSPWGGGRGGRGQGSAEAFSELDGVGVEEWTTASECGGGGLFGESGSRLGLLKTRLL